MKRFLPVFLLTAALAMAQEAGGAPGAEAGDPLLMWKWINFAILVLALGWLMAKTLPGAFRARTESIQKGIAEAQLQKKDADKRAAVVDQRMSALGTEIESFRVQSRLEMEKEGERLREETAAQMRKLEQQSTVEIESAGKAARRELRVYAADLALKLAEERIRTRLTADTESALVNNFVADLKRQESKN
jgi:F-type H+-transporting ATPase subunit b